MDSLKHVLMCFIFANAILLLRNLSPNMHLPRSFCPDYVNVKPDCACASFLLPGFIHLVRDRFLRHPTLALLDLLVFSF